MEKKTARLEAFSDGIFGVAITLLAVEIGIKEYDGATNANLLQKLIDDWPEYFTYFNSFATVLLMWMGHNQIIDRLRKANHWIILINGLVLMFIALFPFPTKLVGSFMNTGAQATAVAVYAGFTGCITLSMLLLNICIVSNKHLIMHPNKNLPWFKKMMKGQVLGFIVYEGAAVLALYYPMLAIMVTFFMWVFWVIVSRDHKDDEQ